MIYLDNASTSYPKPQLVMDGIHKYMNNFGVSPNRSMHKLANQASILLDETRQMIADLIKAEDKNHIVFTNNATHALNFAIKGVLKQEDHVLVCNYSHNSVLRPLEHLKRLNKINYDFFEIDQNGDIDFNAVKSKIRSNTRLVIMNHASNVIGVKSSSKEMSKFCKKHDLLFLLDVTQSIIYEPINVKEEDIDLIAGTGHKSLLGPTGVGFLYVKDAASIESLMEGGSGGTSSLSPIHPMQLPHKLECGTLNMTSISGLHGALSYIFEESIGTISSHSLDLIKILWKKLDDIDEIVKYGTSNFGKKVPILSFNIKNILPSEAAYRYNADFGICVRAGIQCSPKLHHYIGTLPTGTIRVSSGPFNTTDHIKVFIEATKKLIKEGNYNKTKNAIL